MTKREEIARIIETNHTEYHPSKRDYLATADAILAALSPPEPTEGLRERCAQIATDIMNKADVASMELSHGELYGMECRADAAREIAEAIRAMPLQDHAEAK